MVLDPHRITNVASCASARSTSRWTTSVADRFAVRLVAPSSAARRITAASSAASAAAMSSTCAGWIAVGSRKASITPHGNRAIWTALRTQVWLTPMATASLRCDANRPLSMAWTYIRPWS